jgi:hypothetical protein
MTAMPPSPPSAAARGVEGGGVDALFDVVVVVVVVMVVDVDFAAIANELVLTQAASFGARLLSVETVSLRGARSSEMAAS